MTRIVAEIAQAHDGSLGFAHAMIDSAVRAGVTDVKFQIHIAEEESTPSDQFRVQFSKQDKTRYDYWSRISFTIEEWAGIKKHCDLAGISMIASPFSELAVDWCGRLNIGSLKIGSGETGNTSLLNSIARVANEIIASSGMDAWDDIDKLHSYLLGTKKDYYLLQCTSKYPSPLYEIGVNILPIIASKYGCKTGLSDHSGRISPSIVAVSQSFCDMIEVHVTYSKEAFGPDTSSSITFDQLRDLVSLIKDINTIISNPVDKDKLSLSMHETKILFGRSIVASIDITPGTILNESHFSYKKPGGGLAFDSSPLLIGKRARYFVSKNDRIYMDLVMP